MFTPNLIRIVGQTDDARYNPDGTVTRLIAVKFMVGTHGPFTEKFVREGFTAVARDAKLNAFGQEIWIDPPAGH